MGRFDLVQIASEAFERFGAWAFVALFVALFVQTANPIGAALPGNPLLFAIGLFCRAGSQVSLPVFLAIIAAGAFAGSLVGFAVGSRVGPKLLSRPALTRQRERLEEFFDRHGRRAALIGYLVPFVRNFLPTFAGASKMELRDFALPSLAGACLWAILFGGAGYAFGQIPWVRANLDLATYLVLALLIGKASIQGLRARSARS